MRKDTKPRDFLTRCRVKDVTWRKVRATSPGAAAALYALENGLETGSLVRVKPAEGGYEFGTFKVRLVEYRRGRGGAKRVRYFRARRVY